MVLKKQTIWLLTMLSLIIVLSVYYITAPGQSPVDQMAYVEDEDMELEKMNAEAGEVSVSLDDIAEVEDVAKEEGMISSIASDEVFTSIRLDRQISREKMHEEYTNIVGSTDVPAQLRSQALESMEQLRALEQKESMLETLIKAKGYGDVLVITEQNQIKIIVKAEELSAAEANEILLMASEQLGNTKHFAVQFQPSK